jgi:TolA-binding protein
MDKNKHIRLDHNDHLTKEEMIRYVNDQLSAREKHQVEKHTIGCDLCAEALEGVMAMKDTSSLKGILEKIDRRVLGHEEKRTGPTILWMDTRVRVAVAAGAALLIGAVWFFNRNLNESVPDTHVSQTLPLEKDQVTVLDSVDPDKTKTSEEDDLTSTTGKENETLPNSTTSDGYGNGGKDMSPVTEEDKRRSTEGPKFVPADENRKEDQKAPIVVRNNKQEEKSGEVIVTKTETTVTTTLKKELESISDLSQDNVVNSDKTKTVSDEDLKVLKDVEEKKNKNKEQQENIVKKKDQEDKKKTSQKQQEVDLQNKPNTGGSYGFTNVPPQSNQPVPQDKTVVNGNTDVTLNESPKQEPKKDEGYYKSPTDSTSKFLVKLDSVKTSDVNRDGVDDFNGKRYADAEGKFRQSLKVDPKNRESLYYLGATYLEQNKPALAIEQFDKVIALGKGAYYDESRYKKSEALIKQGKKTEAKKILQELIKENGPMKPKAVDLEKKD